MRRTTLVSSLLLLARNVRAGCYYPDGTIDKNVEYQPCSQDASNPLSTICCATNRKDGADICAPNGLCQVGRKKGSPPADAAWTKPSCTNQDWSKDGCLHVCGSDKYPFLTPCNRAAGNESQRWCCGMSQDCCNEDSGLSIEYLPITFDPKNFTDASASSSSLSSSTATSSATKAPSSSASSPTSTSASSLESTSTSTTTTSTSTSTSVPTPEPSTGLSTGAKAGVGVGVSAGALLLVTVGIYFGRRRYTQRSVPEDEAPFEKTSAVYAHWDQSQSRGASSHGGSTVPPATPPKDEQITVVHEMPVAENTTWELDGAGRKTVI